MMLQNLQTWQTAHRKVEKFTIVGRALAVSRLASHQPRRAPRVARPAIMSAAPPHLSLVNPLDVRFAHSRVRPFFSGCGRRLDVTLSSLVRGELPLASLPPIAVLSLPGGLLVSLNNRRLYVLQELARTAPARLLPGGLVAVRLRAGTSADAARYTAERCAATAKLMREPKSAPAVDEAES